MTSKHKLGLKILMVTLGLTLGLSTFSGCFGDKDTLKYADGSWDSIQIQNRIAAFITEHGYGYEPEFIPGETITIIEGIRRGDMDIYFEGVPAQMPEVFDELIDSGDAVNLGISFSPGTWQGWLVPTYMIEDGLLPEGVSVSDMPQYWELFKDPEVPTKGRFYSCIPGWMCQEINIIKMEAYGLTDTYNIFEPGSGAALATSMIAAYEKHEPWFGYYWTPTEILAKLDMTALEEPELSEERWDVDTSTYESAFPILANYIMVTDTLPDELVEFLNQFELENDHLNKALGYMMDTEGEPQDAGEWLVAEYQSLWSQWVPSDVAAKVKAALP